MKYEQMDVSAEKYVVLDVETNGLSGVRDDLLSISLYKPDDGKEYERFLPLELNKKIPAYITEINGIRAKDLKGLSALSQEEVDALFEEFELSRRVILHYGSLDERFIKSYFKRHKLIGFDNMQFFNFKKLICSSRFSYGNMTKDNFCEMFGVKGVTDVHSGLNDCKLEWGLFEKIDGKPLLATEGLRETNIFALTSDYVIPVSYLSSHPNLAKLVDRPYIECESKEIYRFKISGKGVRRFPTNFSGMTIEHLINTMLEVETVDSTKFTSENKRQLKFLGRIKRTAEAIPMSFNPDGTVTAVQKKDKGIERELNAVILELKRKLQPLIDYIKNDIFKGKRILSQELSIDSERAIMALCDLSNEDSILEIKSGCSDAEIYKEQLYYEARGRQCFIMGMDWNYNVRSTELISVEFHISHVHVCIGEKPDRRAESGRRRIERTREKWQNKLMPYGIEVMNYENCQQPISLKCKQCNYEWDMRTYQLLKNEPSCPQCNPNHCINEKQEGKLDKDKKPKELLSPEERFRKRAEAFANKVYKRSEGQVIVDSEDYVGSKEAVNARCNVCGHKWRVRADHLLSRNWCPVCHRMKKI